MYILDISEFISKKPKYFFNEDEIKIIMNARNHKNNHKPRNCDIITYKYATGLEALIGYLYLNNKNNRICEIMEYILNDR